MKKNGFTLAEGATHVEMYGNVRRSAFTLAEVLITLAIIGVVAALTIPTLVANYQKKQLDTADEVFKRRFEETMRIMNVKQTITGYATTKDFVNEFSKNMKIGKICDSDKLTECFDDTFMLDGEEINTNDISTSANLGKDDWNSEVIGLMFNSGVSALMIYNKNCTYTSPYTNKTDDATKCVAMVYDLNGYSNPNTLNKDIKTYGGVTIKNKLIPPVPQVSGYEFEWTDDTYTKLQTTDGRYTNCTGDPDISSSFKCFDNMHGSGLTCNNSAGTWSCSQIPHSGGGSSR